jgi:hypothetical protein
LKSDGDAEKNISASLTKKPRPAAQSRAGLVRNCIETDGLQFTVESTRSRISFAGFGA